MSYRLLHLADLHLDRSFAGLGCHGELARRRREGLRQALRAAGDAAAAAGCQAVTVGGDLYEHDRAGVDTERFLVETFASWQPMRVFLAPGNHDALLPGSVYRRADWPANVHVFAEPRLTAVRLDEGLSLWGLGFRDPAWSENPLELDLPPAGDGVRLALFHGAELGSRPEGKSLHGPFRVEQVRARGFALALCGHYHRRRLDLDGGLVYPGSPEPLAYDEDGRRGPVLVEVGGSGTLSATALDLNAWNVLQARCDLTGSPSPSAALDLAASTCLAAAAGQDGERTLARLDLVGEVGADVAVDVATAEVLLRERTRLAGVKVRDLTSAALDAGELAGERSVRGAFVRAVLAARAAADPAEDTVLADALRYGLLALGGSEVALR